MARTLETTGKSVDAAVEDALQKLGLSREQADIEVLEEAQRGILGIGGRSARVKVTEKETELSRAKAFVEEVVSRMGMNAQVAADESDEVLHLEISGDNMGTLIGYHGETLDALQYLTSLVVNHHTGEYRRVTLDTENYRAKRTESLSRLAENMARKAIRTGRVAMEPMNPYERRILHTSLQENDRVETHSEGEEPYRRVIIVRK